jgi:hypothetical protein
MIEPIEEFFRAFGTTQKPYLSVSKVNSKKIKIMEALKSIKRALLE